MYKVERLFNSRSFSHRTVEARRLPAPDCDSTAPPASSFRLECSFKAHEEDAASFMATQPQVQRPENLPPILEVIKGLDV